VKKVEGVNRYRRELEVKGSACTLRMAFENSIDTIPALESWEVVADDSQRQPGD
jgi:hypothetical protein